MPAGWSITASLCCCLQHTQGYTAAPPGNLRRHQREDDTKLKWMIILRSIWNPTRGCKNKGLNSMERKWIHSKKLYQEHITLGRGYTAFSPHRFFYNQKGTSGIGFRSDSGSVNGGSQSLLFCSRGSNTCSDNEWEKFKTPTELPEEIRMQWEC